MPLQRATPDEEIHNVYGVPVGHRHTVASLRR